MVIRYNIKSGAVIDNAYIDVSKDSSQFIKQLLIELLNDKRITEQEYKEKLMELMIRDLETDFN
jgi:hypothetical protein